MADTLKAEGLVIAAMDSSGNVYPFACATNSSITISGETLEIATISNNAFRSFVSGRQSFTISGTGLAKMTETNMNGINFFDNFITGTNTKFKCFLPILRGFYLFFLTFRPNIVLNFLNLTFHFHIITIKCCFWRCFTHFFQIFHHFTYNWVKFSPN